MGVACGVEGGWGEKIAFCGFLWRFHDFQYGISKVFACGANTCLFLEEGCTLKELTFGIGPR